MKKLHKHLIMTTFVVGMLLSLSATNPAYAATSPSLGAAASFSILSGTGATNTGITTISGDLGVSPAASYTDSGSTTFLTPGNPHLADGPAAAAQLANVAAFGALDAGTNADANCIGGILPSGTDLSTLSPLGPGLYCSGGTFLLTGNLTLTGTTGTWVFKTVSGLVTSVGSSVTGGDPCNVWWRVGSTATIEVGTNFRGNILAGTAINVKTGASLNGRAFAQTAAATLDTNIVSGPVCTALPGGGGRRFATLNVVKTVINDNGGTSTLVNFPLFVNGTLVVSGETNVFNPGSYAVTETSNVNYTQTFSGDCDAAGNVELFLGTNLLCIVTNNDIGSPVAVAPVPPLIDVVKVPNPLALPNGPANVQYTYTARNIGTVPMTNVTMVGDTCRPIILFSGDINNDNILDVNETWTYICSTRLDETHTNTVVATGWANGLSAVDIASATVVVGAPVIPPLIHVTKRPLPLTLLDGGGMVTYSERITNPGTVALSNVRLTDNTCSPMRYVGGDRDRDGMLDPNEIWRYTCRTQVNTTTTNTAIASGEANGITVRDFAIATVVVALPVRPAAPIVAPTSTGVPALPRTGFQPHK